MATYTVNAYEGNLGLTQQQLLAWSGANVSSITSTQIRLQVRDGGAVALPGDYDLILSGSFTIIAGILTGGTVTSISGRSAGGATTLSSISGLGLPLQTLITSVSPPAFSNPNVDTLFAGSDTLTGSTLSDTLRGSGGADTMDGGLGNDTFVFAGSQTAAGESINGGGDFDTIRITGGTNDFRQVTISNVEQIDFTATAASTAQFLGTQFGTFRITNIDGSTAVNSLIVTGPLVDLSVIQFSNWSANDTITINGDSANPNALTGTTFADTINGGSDMDAILGNGGADQLSGGLSDDTFRFTAGSQVVSGLSINGGPQNDRLNLESGTGFQFSLATLTGVEQVSLFATNQSVEFRADQLGASAIIRFQAPSTVGTAATINVIGATNLDLSAAVLINFDSSDRFVIGGTAAADTIKGSAANDVILGAAGADNMDGGGGDDTFTYNVATEATSGETINGGAGLADTIRIATTVFSTTDFRQATISGVERLEFAGAQLERAIGRFKSQQALQFTQIVGGTSDDSFFVDVTGSADFSSLTFANWTFFDKVFLAGDSLANTITGTSQHDSINGGAGADTLNGGNGNDSFTYLNLGEITAGETVNGSGGADTVEVANGNTYDFTSVTFTSVEVLRFSQNNNTIILSSSQIGSSGFSQLIGTTVLGGIDTLIVNGSNTNLSSLGFSGWNGATDTITLSGTAGVDNLIGSLQKDILNGGNGGDNLWGGDGADVHNGGDDAGLDFARYDDANNGNLTIRLDAPNLNTGVAAGDTYVGIEGLVGGVGKDTIFGNASNNFLFGGAEADSILGQDGVDHLDGGAGGDNLWGGTGADKHIGGDDAGLDFARYDDANHGNLTIRLDNATFNAGAAAVGDTYTGIEGLVGGAGADVIIGNASANFLFGQGNADFIDGLAGGDTLNGGADADRFRFSTTLGAGNVDTIADFVHLTDDILLTTAIFASVGATLTADEIRFGAAAVDANDFIIYNAATGALSYDANGSTAGGAGQIQFATVTAGTVLTFDDFVVV